MYRITVKMLEGRVDYLNKLTGNALTPWHRPADGKLYANIGNYHLDGAYGGYQLHQMCNESGGITCISDIGYASKRDLFNWINAYIAGIESQELTYRD